MLHAFLIGDWFASYGVAKIARDALAAHEVGPLTNALRELLACLPWQPANAELTAIFAPALALKGMFPIGFDLPDVSLGMGQQVLVYLHKALSTTLFFLFGLAVRNRVKMT